MNTLLYHWRTFRRMVAEDRARKKGWLRSSEPDFLPAALEVIDRPVSPTWRATAWVLLAGIVALMGWLVFGRVDIVASAPGRIIPTDDVKLVQAANTGVVRRIYVHDGDSVRRGEPLIDLDPTVSTAEESQAEKALLAADLDVARDRAIADALAGKGIHFAPPAAAPPDIAETQRKLIEAQVAEVDAETAGLAAARQSALADARGAAEKMRTLDETGPILDREVSAMNGLSAKGYAPGLRLLELERQRRSEAGDRDVAAAEQAHGLSDARKFEDQLTQSREQARQTALGDLVKAQNEAILRREEVVKTRRRSGLQRLVAPVDGTIQQVAVHTLGGVVESIRPLMVVVPNGALIVEAHVLNRDAGFVHAGQAVAVKLEAFPFTRYGAIPGSIISLSRDSVNTDKSGAYFIARVRLDQSVIMADGARVPLIAGLDATTDIRIGSRRIIDYIVSPIRAAGDEAAREK